MNIKKYVTSLNTRLSRLKKIQTAMLEVPQELRNLSDANYSMDKEKSENGNRDVNRIQSETKSNLFLSCLHMVQFYYLIRITHYLVLTTCAQQFRTYNSVSRNYAEVSRYHSLSFRTYDLHYVVCTAYYLVYTTYYLVIRRCNYLVHVRTAQLIKNYINRK